MLPEIDAEPVQLARLDIDPAVFRTSFDRTPFGLTHNLSELKIFQMDSLLGLADAYGDRQADYYVTTSAPSAGTVFFSVPAKEYTAREALDRLHSDKVRLLLKRPENYHPGFKALLDRLFQQVMELRGGLGAERIVRLESGVFITSAATTTPFHFDPEIAFFAQIEGEKNYHLFPPATLSEIELEKFYLQGAVSIGQVDLARRNPQLERVFALSPGKGLHQPQDSPHWVQTGDSRSISYSFVYETDVSRARGRTRACNYYARKFGLQPAPLGVHPSLDALKAAAMRTLIPLRQGARQAVRTFLPRKAPLPSAVAADRSEPPLR
jgi:hypothetical protein